MADVDSVWRIREGTIDQAYAVYDRIPELEAGAIDRSEFTRRLGKPSALVLIGERTRSNGVTAGEEDLIGFKAGYDRYQDGSWYSWLGGVVPSGRGSGLASALLRYQETWVRDAGYRRIYVKTRNRFVAMRLLLTRAGYQVVAVEASDVDTSLDDLGLLMVKAL